MAEFIKYQYLNQDGLTKEQVHKIKEVNMEMLYRNIGLEETTSNLQLDRGGRRFYDPLTDVNYVFYANGYVRRQHGNTGNIGILINKRSKAAKKPMHKKMELILKNILMYRFHEDRREYWNNKYNWLDVMTNEEIEERLS